MFDWYAEQQRQRDEERRQREERERREREERERLLYAMSQSDWTAKHG